MKQLFLWSLGVVCLLTSCKKNDNNHSGPYTSLQSVYQGLAVTGKTMSVDAATGGSFYGNSGTRYVFQPNSFVTTTGAPVTGTVQVEVKEWLKREDMIFSRMLPVSNGEPLLSGGEYYVNATQNGQQVLVKNGKAFQVALPQGGTPPPGMSFFLGVPTPQAPNAVNWLGKDSSHAQGLIIYNGDTLSVFTDSIGYGNADMFMTNPNYKSFTINIAGVSIPANTSVMSYALYDNYKAVWGMYNLSGNTISENHVPDIPVHFVVMTVVDGNFYGGITAATPANGGSYTVVLVQTTPSAFKALISALP